MILDTEVFFFFVIVNRIRPRMKTRCLSFASICTLIECQREVELGECNMVNSKPLENVALCIATLHHHDAPFPLSIQMSYLFLIPLSFIPWLDNDNYIDPFDSSKGSQNFPLRF